MITRKRAAILASAAALAVASSIGVGVAVAASPTDNCEHATYTSTSVKPLEINGVTVAGIVNEYVKRVTNCPGWVNDTTHITRDIKNVPIADVTPIPHN